jgi:hypothetical protein
MSMKGVKLNKSRQLANDLRRSHFTLGTADARLRNSEYVSEYQEKKTAIEGSQKTKLDLRASHFQFGNHDPAKMFHTVSQNDFKAHQGFQPSKLNEDKKRDLRASHFVLGHDQNSYASLSHINFPEKHIPVGLHKQEQEEQKNKMRKHNHDFTETSKKQFASEYHATYNKLNDPASLKQALSARELQQKVVDLRKSHVVLGEDFHPMKSIAQIDYQSKKGGLVKPANDNVNIRRTNFQLGVTPNEFASMYQQSFVPHPAQKSELQGSLMKELRATHFSLGQDEGTFASHMGASYKNPPTGFKPPQTLNPSLQKNHFSLGAAGSQLQNKTTYSTYHQNFEGTETAQARDQNMDRGSHFKLGGEKENWASEAQSHFKPHAGAKPADLEGSLKADLRSSHFKFSDVKPNSQFKTMQQASYGAKSGEPGKLDANLKKDLQAGHFKLGTTPNPYATTSGSAFRPNEGKASELDPRLAKDLRSNHFSHGDGKWQLHAGTEYRSNFFWKNNEEEA